ncbi:MAG: DDE-type integrase/transposase/recombinase [Acidimicrobiia bacterium]
MEDDHRRDIALFRYSLIREAADPELTKRERGRLVRRLAAREHVRPDGRRVRIGRSTLDRWVRAYRAGGYEALVPDPRAGVPLTCPEILDAAVVLKREEPKRTAAHVAQVLATQDMAVSARTLQRHFARLGLNESAPTRRSFGRFEATRRNELWTGDAMHARFAVAARKPVLFAFVDDHSRLIPGWRWALTEDTLRLEIALRAGLASRGIPTGIYVDNGSPFASAQLDRACAKLGIRLVHSRPGEPAGRGKIERFFRTVRDGFEVEAARAAIADLAELNRLFAAWVEQVYHRRVHSETGQAPLERFMTDGAPELPSLTDLHEAFLWTETRLVTKTATVSLFGNHYEVDAHLIGRRVELVFDPFDLTDIEVRWAGRGVGTASPQRISRHVHPKARPDAVAPALEPSGIDYLRLIETRHDQATRTQIAYSSFAETTDTEQLEGQLQIPDTTTTNTEEPQP